MKEKQAGATPEKSGTAERPAGRETERSTLSEAERPAGRETERSTLSEAERLTVCKAERPAESEVIRVTLSEAEQSTPSKVIRLTLSEAEQSIPSKVKRLTVSEAGRPAVGEAERLTVSEAERPIEREVIRSNLRETERQAVSEAGRLTVSEVERLTGVSVRALHYYDAIGLLSPREVTESGYRMYGRDELLRLQQVLLYRELGFPLKEIPALLDGPVYGEAEALRRQRELLKLKRDRLEAIMRLIDDRLKGETNMSFSEFDTAELDRARKTYAAEARERWGATKEYAESEAKAAERGADGDARLAAGAAEIFAAFAAVSGGDPAGAEAATLVKRWQAYISANYYECSDAMLANLGLMYTADDRFKANIDRAGAGTAEFMAAAIAAYCSR